MKVIDIFNKIANGEEVPTFRIDDDRYKYFMKGNLLYCQKYDNEPEPVDWQIYTSWLNEEVEIIEEAKEIEELRLNNGKLNGTWENGNNYCYTLSAPQTVLLKKINELTKAVNKLSRDD